MHAAAAYIQRQHHDAHWRRDFRKFAAGFRLRLAEMAVDAADATAAEVAFLRSAQEARLTIAEKARIKLIADQAQETARITIEGTVQAIAQFAAAEALEQSHRLRIAFHEMELSNRRREEQAALEQGRL